MFGSGTTFTITGGTAVNHAFSAFSNLNLGTYTVSSASATTVTNAANLYIAGAPTGGGAGPVTITNAYALWVDAGTTRLDGLLALSAIAAGSPNMQITATTDVITNPFLAATGVTRAPAGWMELLVGGVARYIPFWTIS